MVFFLDILEKERYSLYDRSVCMEYAGLKKGE